MSEINKDSLLSSLENAGFTPQQAKGLHTVLTQLFETKQAADKELRTVQLRMMCIRFGGMLCAALAVLAAILLFGKS
ncbi:MAG: hypothetical protein J6I40_05520 [Mailhella sp.]|nr:hypothetical protein [Mailhella sp.]